jgi:hypothetical protein
MIRFTLPGARKQPAVDITLALELSPYKDSARVIVVDAEGKRIKNGNLIKIVPNEGVYLYHTIDPRFGLPTDEDGRLVLLDENPHNT